MSIVWNAWTHKTHSNATTARDRLNLAPKEGNTSNPAPPAVTPEPPTPFFRNLGPEPRPNLAPAAVSPLPNGSSAPVPSKSPMSPGRQPNSFTFAPHPNLRHPNLRHPNLRHPQKTRGQLGPRNMPKTNHLTESGIPRITRENPANNPSRPGNRVHQPPKPDKSGLPPSGNM